MGAQIITWNVNGIRAIQKKGFLDWLEQENPDILCIQETKAHPEQLDESLLSPNGYFTYWASAEKKGYSGLATYTKEKPLEVRGLGVPEFDSEGRVQILIYPSYTLINAYFPNSQDKGKRLDYKEDFCQAMLNCCEELRTEGHHLILCGDYNIAHKRIDLARPDDNEESPGFFLRERQWMDRFVEAGYVDVFREFDQSPDQYTWWSYRTKARERNIGWRIDYHCVNEEFKDRVEYCEILSDVYGSDHCPVRLFLT